MAPEVDRPGHPATRTRAQALRAGAARLAHLPAARLEAERLLAHILGTDRARLLASGREPLRHTEDAAYEALLTRREAGEPLAYLLGWSWFGDLRLEVTRAVLVPRPETELLATWAADWCRARPTTVRVLDVGTGSGALAVAIASGAANADVVATDIDREALAVADRNLRRYGLTGRVRLVAADLLPPEDVPFDLVVANLPYVAIEDADLAPEVAAWEPPLALYGGVDGLVVIRRLLECLPPYLAPGGAVGLEIGWRQGRQVAELAALTWPTAEVLVQPDLAACDRLVTIQCLP